jgi:hypothetical protein
MNPASGLQKHSDARGIPNQKAVARILGGRACRAHAPQDALELGSLGEDDSEVPQPA